MEPSAGNRRAPPAAQNSRRRGVRDLGSRPRSRTPGWNRRFSVRRSTSCFMQMNRPHTARARGTLAVRGTAVICSCRRRFATSLFRGCLAGRSCRAGLAARLRSHPCRTDRQSRRLDWTVPSIRNRIDCLPSEISVAREIAPRRSGNSRAFTARCQPPARVDRASPMPLAAPVATATLLEKPRLRKRPIEKPTYRRPGPQPASRPSRSRSLGRATTAPDCPGAAATTGCARDSQG